MGVGGWKAQLSGLHEFYTNALKKLGQPARDTREHVLLLVAWQPVETSLAVIERAWHWMDESGLSYWDALIVSAAELSGCRWLLTEDLQDRRVYEGLTVVNPFRVSAGEFGL